MTRTCLYLSRKSALFAISIVPAFPAWAADYVKEAQNAVAAPFKVAVKPMGQGLKAGDPIDVSLQLQNGKSQPSAASKYTPIQVQLIGTSGAVVQSETCGIQPRSTDGKCTFQAVPANGIYKLRALPVDRQLLEGSGFLLVLPKDEDKAPPPGKPRSRLNDGIHPPWLPRSPGWLPRNGVFLLNAAYDGGDSGNGATETSGAAGGTTASGCKLPLARGAAKVALLINEGGEDGGAFRAAVEPATITAFFEADDTGAAPRDIRVWLSPDHGSLNPPYLTIPACSYTGDTRLSSKYPVVASVAYTVTPASYPVDGHPQLTARFLRPIVAVHVEPSGTQTLSLIDRGPFVTELIDVNGSIVPTDLDRNLTFVSNSSVAGPKLQAITLKTGQFDASNIVLPFSPGKAAISVTGDRVQTATLDVEVVGTAVYLYCLIGGVLGGLISAINAGGFKISRIVTGVVCGIVLAWAYVFGLVPNVDSSVAHNYISVLVISILGGYAGTKVFTFVFQRFGWSL